MLETERLILRSLALSDAEAVELYASDYDVAKYTTNIPHPYPKGSAVDFIQASLLKEKSGRLATFAITKKENKQLIGLMGMEISPEHRHAELGYWVGKPFWRKGYGTEAAKAVVDYGFRQLGLNKIYACAVRENRGSWRIMEKVGMTYEGMQKQHFFRFGRYIDLVHYGILREDYEKTPQNN